MGSWNPSANGTVGLEWLPTDALSSFVVNSATTAYGLTIPALPGTAPWNKGFVYASQVSGVSTCGVDLYSAPLVSGVPTTTEIDYPGTDTGADFTSPLNGGNAWQTQAAGAATYANVDPGVAGTTYLQNVNAFEYPQCWMMMRGANATQMVGKRVLSVQVYAVMNSNMTNPPTTTGYLRIGGTNYAGFTVGAPVNAGSVYMLLGSWQYNPATNAPWTLAAVNNLITTGGTDSFGFASWWVWQAAAALQVSQVYLQIKWQPEDRIGVGSGPVSAKGWQQLAMESVPNLLTAQQSSLEGGATTGWAGISATLTNSAANAYDGTKSLLCTATAGTAFGASTAGSGAVCIPTKTYSAAVPVRVVTGAPRTVQAFVGFYDAAGNLLSQTLGTGVASNNAWVVPTVGPVTAPAGSATVVVGAQTTAGTIGNTMHIDGVMLTLADAALSFTANPGPFSNIPQGGATLGGVCTQGRAGSLVIRRRSGSGNFSMPTISPGASTVGMPYGFASTRPVLIDSAGAIADASVVKTDCTGFYAATTGSVFTGTAQPYVSRLASTVDTTNTVKSEITLPASTFRLVRLVVSGAIDPPNAPLLIKLKKVSDDSQVGGTATINPTDLAQVTAVGYTTASRVTPQIIVAKLASDAVAGAVQHYFEFTSTASAGLGWNVYALDDADGSAGGLDGSTFNGTTDAFNDPLNGARNTGRDGLVTIQSIPTTPGSLAALAVNP